MMMEWRTAGGCRCKCGLSLASHAMKPAYFGGERFGDFSSTAEREAGCKAFRYDRNPPRMKGKKFNMEEA